MLAELFGGNTAEKILLYLEAMGRGYSSEIARSFNISNTQTLRTLENLENAEILVAQNIGRTRIYQLNDRWYLAKELKSLLNKALLFIPLDEQEKYFGQRKKPRKKGKRE